jgi:uncharacterized membrane protein YfcA
MWKRDFEMINIPLFFVLLILGIIIGLLASVCGLGGGFILVPTLILVFNLSPQNTIAVSLLAMCGTTISAALGYIKKESGLQTCLTSWRIRYSLSNRWRLPNNNYKQKPADWFIRVFILVLSVLMLRNLRVEISSKNDKLGKSCNGWGRKLSDSMNKAFEYNIRRPSLVVISSLMSGLVTGLVGLGRVMRARTTWFYLVSLHT